MERYRAKELSEFYEAYSKGKTIQIFIKKGSTVGGIPVDSDTWFDLKPNAMELNSDKYYEYRIKPEPKLVPFTFEDNKLFRDKFIALNPKSAIFRMTSINLNGVSVSGTAGGQVISYKQLFDDYQFEDGSPLGKYINE